MKKFQIMLERSVTECFFIEAKDENEARVKFLENENTLRSQLSPWQYDEETTHFSIGELE